MKAPFIKIDGNLIPASDEAREFMASLPVGEELLMDYTIGRSAANHRRFFAFRNLTFDWQDTYHDKEVWRGILLLLGGHFTTVTDKKGNTHLWPNSINWKEMDDEAKFRALFSAIIDGYLKSDYARNLTNEQLTMVVQF